MRPHLFTRKQPNEVLEYVLHSILDTFCNDWKNIRVEIKTISSACLGMGVSRYLLHSVFKELGIVIA